MSPTLRSTLKASTHFIRVTLASPCPAPRLVDVDLFRRNGAPANAGCYLVHVLHAASAFSVEERIKENGRPLIPPAGIADLDPAALLGTSFGLYCLTLRLLVYALTTLMPITSQSQAQSPPIPWMWTRPHHHSAWIPSSMRRNSPDTRRLRGLFGSACRLLPFTCPARAIEHRPTHELSTSMEPLVVAPARNRI